MVQSWRVQAILHHQLHFSEIAPRQKSSYFPLCKELNNSMRIITNIQKGNENDSNKLFKG